MVWPGGWAPGLCAGLCRTAGGAGPCWYEWHLRASWWYPEPCAGYFLVTFLQQWVGRDAMRGRAEGTSWARLWPASPWMAPPPQTLPGPLLRRLWSEQLAPEQSLFLTVVTMWLGWLDYTDLAFVVISPSSSPASSSVSSLSGSISQYSQWCSFCSALP